MKATKRIRKLLKDLQAFADGDLDAPDGYQEAHQGQGSSTHLQADDTDAAAAEVAATDAGGSENGTPVDCSTCSTTDPSTQSSSNVSKVFRDEVERLVQQLGDSRILVATLMAEINILHQEKARQDSQQSLVIQRLEEEVTHLQRQAHRDLALLKARQDQIELDVPILEDQLKSLKAVLQDFNVSENLYAELLAMPEEKRSVKAHLQLLAYQKMKGFKEEVDSIRKERDTSREALTRENAEVEKVHREIQRVLAEAALSKREVEKDMGAMIARNERLEAEVRDALVNVEVLSAKGSMYDEVKEKLEKAEQNAVDTDNQKAVMTATLQILSDEKQRLLEVIKDKDHCLDLLSMDKIYLSREVKAQLDQVKKLEQELEHQQEKLRSLKSTKKELYNKVLNDGRDAQAAHEQRLQAELSRLRERANQDIEQIRIEASEVADEKVRTFREMRDAALAEAERVQAISRESKSMHDEILSKYQELQRVSEAREIKDQSEMKVKCFELEQLRVVQQEIRSILNQKSIDNEALVEKVKLLTEKYHILEMESGQALAGLKSELETAHTRLRVLTEKHQRLEELFGKPFATLKYELEEARTRIRIYEQRLEMQENRVAVTHGRRKTLGIGDGSEEGGSGSKKKTATSRNSGKQRRPSSSGKNVRVQTTGDELHKERAENKEKGKELKDIGEASTRHAKYIEQPQTYAMSINASTAENLHATEESKPHLESELRKARTENEHVCQRLHNLQRDLKRILQARGTMENFQRLLRDKGIHISDDVIKRITRSRSESIT